MLKKGKNSFKKQIAQITLTKKLSFYRHEHSNLIILIIIFNNEFVSSLMLALFCVNVPISVSFHSMLLFSETSKAVKWFCINFIFAQIIITIITSIQLHQVTMAVYSSIPKLNSIQPFIGLKFLSEKIKTLFYFELLHKDDKVGYSLGAMGKINKLSLLKVSGGDENGIGQLQ